MRERRYEIKESRHIIDIREIQKEKREKYRSEYRERNTGGGV
jgi:hypothetical protein